MVSKSVESSINRPSPGSTATLLAGVLVAYFVKGEGSPSEIARFSAVIVGAVVVCSLATDWVLTNARNLVRLDNAAIVALYFLTLFEFLFPQQFFDALVSSDQVETGIDLVLLGLATLAVGRHFPGSKPLGNFIAAKRGMNHQELFWLAVFAFGFGHLHMWLAVNFNLVEWLGQMTGARFTQSWQRGRTGGWHTLVQELHWATYLVPAIAAILWVRRKDVPRHLLFGVAIMTALTLFGGFSLGARYRFAFYLLSFCGGFFLSQPSLRATKIVKYGVPIAVGFVVLSFVVVNFRSIGMKKTAEIFIGDTNEGYTGAREELVQRLSEDNGFKFIVDRNLYPISVLPSYFPDRHDFLGEEILFSILGRPIPRALWPSKPESLSVTTEGILGVENATIASTFVGEGYMAYGRAGVVLFGLGLGILAGFWNRIPVDPFNSTQVLLYSSGFVWIALATRSIVWISVGFLPAVFLFVYAWGFVPFLGESRRRTAVSATASAPVSPIAHDDTAGR